MTTPTGSSGAVPASSTAVPVGEPIADPVGQGAGADTHHGPSDGYYIRIAVALAVITAVEVAWSYLPWDDWGDSSLLVLAEVGGLIAMMVVKFVIVASNFMHLKFDDKILTRVFYAGLTLAIGVYIAALLTFELFSGEAPGFL
ncbi:MAG TPA: cytochrome C oxidase subunit IV family protein [Aquihabitans sp.]|jgi:cytochrome c oxidase subunit 4|nr:cytochrome C oxidase subunit IV family protein [Aquihabitans sp.]